MGVASVAFLLFSFLGRVVVARFVSLDAWGIFNLGVSLAGFLSLIGLLGLHQATARTLSHETDAWVRRKVVRVGLTITVVDATVVSTILFVLAAPLASIFRAGAADSSLTLAFQMLSVTVGFTLLGSFLAALFQGFERVGPNAWFNQALNPALFLAFVVLFFVFHLGFFGALLAYVAASGVAFTGLALYTLTRLPPLLIVPTGVRRTDVRVPPEFWQLSRSLWGVNSLVFVTTFIDLLILGVYWPATTVGLYSAATTLARLFLVASTALGYVYLPVSSRLDREGLHGAIRSTYVTTTRWIVAICFPMLALFLFLPGQSLQAVFGATYVGGGEALQILVVGAFVSVSLGPVSSCLAGLGRSTTLNVTSGISAALAVALSLALIPRYGLLGAAIAWTVARIAYTGLGALALFLNGRVTAYRRSLFVPTSVALATTLPLYFALGVMRAPPWIVFPLYFLGLGIFLTATLLSRSLQADDLLVLRIVERSVGRPLPALRRFFSRYIGTPARDLGTGDLLSVQSK